MSKTPIKTGLFVSYTLAIECLEVTGDVRKSVREGDADELPGTQLAFTHENVIVGESLDPNFLHALMGKQEGDIVSFKINHPDYDRENIVTLPLAVLKSNGIGPERLKPGMIIGKQLLKGKVSINDEAAELEILQIHQQGGQAFVVLDANDVFRGLHCQYDIEVDEVREPTADEVRELTTL